MYIKNYNKCFYMFRFNQTIIREPTVCYNKNYQQMRLLYYVFISFFSSFPYMFRAFVGPSSGVFQAVVFMLPFGSCSALLIVCVRPLTQADDQQSTA